jgi:hypothetical protein
VALRSEKLLHQEWLQRGSYVNCSDPSAPRAALSGQQLRIGIRRAGIRRPWAAGEPGRDRRENKRLASCALCFDSGTARGATDAVIASADDGFILPRGFDQRHLAMRRYRIATDRFRVNLRRSPHYKALRLL